MTATTTRAAETWAHLLRCQHEGVPAFPWALDFAQDGYGDLAEARDAVEAVAQQHLDAHPDDHAARRLLGEWLTACGDERGPGYVALGSREIHPRYLRSQKWHFCWNYLPTWERRQLHEWSRKSDHYVLPQEWTAAYWDFPPEYEKGRDMYGFDTRTDAEDAAAKAFLRLPPARREQLLKGEM